MKKAIASLLKQGVTIFTHLNDLNALVEEGSQTRWG